MKLPRSVSRLGILAAVEGFSHTGQQNGADSLQKETDAPCFRYQRAGNWDASIE